MRLLKRAAVSGLALVLVLAILAGVHGLVHAVHRRNKATPVMRSVAVSKLPLSKRPLSKLPLLLSETGSEKRSGDSTWNSQSWWLDEPSDSIGSVSTGASLASAESEDAPHTARQTGGVGPAAREPPPRLMPSPPSTNAVPLPPAGGDWPLPDPRQRDLPAREPVPPDSRQSPSSGRRIIDKELPDSSTEERDLWHETMKDLPPNDLRELLRLRAQLGRLSPPFLELHPTPSRKPFLSLKPQTAEAGPLYSPPNDGAASPGDDPDLERILSESLAALKRARLVLLENIANARTNGYKRRLISFESAGEGPKPARSTASVPRPQGREATVGCGARLGSLVFDRTPGKLRRTDRSLDLAIDGEGFFQLTGPKGERDGYTRCGRFTTDAAGRIALRTSRGDWLLQPSLTIPPGTTEIEIGTDGVVRLWDGSDQSMTQVGTIQTASFRSQDCLESLDGTIFTVPAAMTAATVCGAPGVNGHGRLRAGYLEESNVDLKQEFEELTRLAEQAQMLRQAARLIHVPGRDRAER